MSISERKAYMERRDKITTMLISCGDPLFRQFFDFDSDKMLDEKLEVLEKLNKGIPPADIPNYYKVLELYPAGEHSDDIITAVLWD